MTTNLAVQKTTYNTSQTASNTHRSYANQKVADKENNTRANRLPTTASVANVLKRSKTAEMTKPPVVTSASNPIIADREPEKPKLTDQTKIQDCSKVMEERKKERMKMLTRTLEVCDLLEVRNPQSVAEFAPAIYKYLHSQEKEHVY